MGAIPAGYERAPVRVRLGVGAAILVILVALGATVAAGLLGSDAPPVETVAPVAAGPDAEAPVYVHVRGAVRSPGLHRLSSGARIVDAIAAAGGFAEKADEGALNLARTVSDGEQIDVPEMGAVPAVAGPGEPADSRVNLNTATDTELETLPRIGPALAGRIIAWRDEHGAFSSVDQLTDVPGIGDRMIEALRDLVTI